MVTLNPSSCSLPASLPREGRMPTSETGEDWTLRTQVTLGHLADMGLTCHVTPGSMTGDRVALLSEVRGDLETEVCQTHTSHVWALLLKVTQKKKVTLTWHLAEERYWKVHRWSFSETQEHAHCNFNDYTFTCTSVFKNQSV